MGLAILSGELATKQNEPFRLLFIRPIICLAVEAPNSYCTVIRNSALHRFVGWI
jgi:hypothetical protein